MTKLQAILNVVASTNEKSASITSGRPLPTNLGVVSLQKIDPHWADKVMKDPSRLKSKLPLSNILDSTYQFDPDRKEKYEEYVRDHKLDRFLMTKIPDLEATLYEGKVSSDDKYYNPKILLNNDGSARILCNCPDYTFTWVYSNLRGHISLGHEIPSPIFEEQRHSGGAIGMCKHIFLLGNKVGLV